MYEDSRFGSTGEKPVWFWRRCRTNETKVCATRRCATPLLLQRILARLPHFHCRNRVVDALGQASRWSDQTRKSGSVFDEKNPRPRSCCCPDDTARGRQVPRAAKAEIAPEFRRRPSGHAVRPLRC